jgi:hypothetical protein
VQVEDAVAAESYDLLGMKLRTIFLKMNFFLNKELTGTLVKVKSFLQ